MADTSLYAMPNPMLDRPSLTETVNVELVLVSLMTDPLRVTVIPLIVPICVTMPAAIVSDEASLDDDVKVLSAPSMVTVYSLL